MEKGFSPSGTAAVDSEAAAGRDADVDAAERSVGSALSDRWLWVRSLCMLIGVVYDQSSTYCTQADARC